MVLLTGVLSLSRVLKVLPACEMFVLLVQTLFSFLLMMIFLKGNYFISRCLMLMFIFYYVHCKTEIQRMKEATMTAFFLKKSIDTINH